MQLKKAGCILPGTMKLPDLEIKDDLEFDDLLRVKRNQLVELMPAIEAEREALKEALITIDR